MIIYLSKVNWYGKWQLFCETYCYSGGFFTTGQNFKYLCMGQRIVLLSLSYVWLESSPSLLLTQPPVTVSNHLQYSLMWFSFPNFREVFSGRASAIKSYCIDTWHFHLRCLMPVTCHVQLTKITAVVVLNLLWTSWYKNVIHVSLDCGSVVCCILIWLN